MEEAAFTTRAAGALTRTSEGDLAFVPSPAPRAVDSSPEVVALLDEASHGLGLLAGIGRRLPNPHLLIAPYLRREAVLSSRIEGTVTSLSDIYAFEAEQLALVQAPDVKEVRNYVLAYEHGLERLRTLPLSLRFIREVHGWLGRSMERIKALGMMLQEAERARTEAEQSVPTVSSEEITATLSAEIKARDLELARLRAQAAQLQDQLAAARSQKAVIDGDEASERERLQSELAGAFEQVRSDRAEVRSLVVEIIAIATPVDKTPYPELYVPEYLKKVTIPTLDIFGGNDDARVVSTAAQRSQAMRAALGPASSKSESAKNADVTPPRYRQVALMGADHEFTGMDGLLGKRVVTWLGRYFAEVEK